MQNELNNECKNLIDKADELFVDGRSDEALDFLDKVSDDCDDYSTAMFMKSMILADMGDEEKSFKAFQCFLAEEWGEEYVNLEEEYRPVDMNDSKELFEYGLTNYYVFRDYAKAIEYFNRSLKINPNQSEVLHYKALAFSFLGKHKKAVKIIGKAIEIDPDKVSYWNDMGVFFYRMNHISKAHSAFDRANKIEQNPYSWSNKATLYYEVGKLDKALECFDRAIELDGNDMDSIIGKAHIYSEMNDFKKADECFSRACQIDARDIGYLAEMGRHLLNQKKFSQAVEYFDECLKIDDELAFVWMYKSMALCGMGRDEESGKCAKKAAELDPDSLSLLDEVIIIED